MSSHCYVLRSSSRPSGLLIGLACIAVLGGLHCVVPRPAHAIDNTTIAKTMADQAGKSFAAGDFAKAADLYQKAFRLDSQPPYLWALARAEHLAANYDGAIEHYRQFIAAPGAEAPRVAKAQAYLTDVEQELSRMRVREGDAASRSGNPRGAAELYLAAWKLAPGEHELLFRAAVAEQLDGQDLAAIQHFEDYLARATQDARERPQAQARLTSLRQKIAAPQAKPAAAQTQKPAVGTPAPGVVATAPTAAAPKWPAWAAIGGGAALAGSGLVLLLGANADASQLAADQTHGSGQSITKLSYAEAVSRADEINSRSLIGWGLAGAGVVSAGVGTWLLLRQPERKVALLPSGDGLLLAGRF